MCHNLFMERSFLCSILYFKEQGNPRLAAGYIIEKGMHGPFL